MSKRDGRTDGRLDGKPHSATTFSLSVNSHLSSQPNPPPRVTVRLRGEREIHAHHPWRKGRKPPTRRTITQSPSAGQSYQIRMTAHPFRSLRLTPRCSLACSGRKVANPSERLPSPSSGFHSSTISREHSAAQDSHFGPHTIPPQRGNGAAASTNFSKGNIAGLRDEDTAYMVHKPRPWFLLSNPSTPRAYTP